MAFAQEFEETDLKEVEWQFAVPDLELVERWLLQRAGDYGLAVRQSSLQELSETYYDTADWRFYRAGYKLRLREHGTQVEATLKSLMSGQPEDSGYRRELMEELPEAGPEALMRAQGQVGAWARGLAGDEPLKRLFRTQTWRQGFLIRYEEARIGEIALEKTRLPSREHSPGRHWKRVRINMPETQNGVIDPFLRELRSACRLKPVSTSKYSVALEVHGLEPWPAGHFSMRPFDSGMTIGAFALAVIGRLYIELWRKELTVRIEEDLASLEELRRALSRLHAAMLLFGRYVEGNLRRKAEDLAWLAEGVSGLHQLELALQTVQQEKRRDAPPTETQLLPVEKRWRQRRGQVRRRLMKRLDSTRYGRMKADLRGLLENESPAEGEIAGQPALNVLAEEIESRYKATLQSSLACRVGNGERGQAVSPNNSIENLMLLLQYSWRFFDGAEDALRQCAEDLYGLVEAHREVTSIYEVLSSEATGDTAWPGEALFALGMVTRGVIERDDRLRKECYEMAQKLRGTPWKQLRAALKRGAPSAGKSGNASLGD